MLNDKTESATVRICNTAGLSARLGFHKIYADKCKQTMYKRKCNHLQTRTGGPITQTMLLLLSRFTRIRLCDPTEGSPTGSTIPGILQARILEWVAISFSNAWKWKVKVKVKSCPTPRDPMDCSPPGSSIHGIFQARVLEWGAIAFSEICYLGWYNVPSKE